MKLKSPTGIALAAAVGSNANKHRSGSDPASNAGASAAAAGRACCRYRLRCRCELDGARRARWPFRAGDLPPSQDNASYRVKIILGMGERCPLLAQSGHHATEFECPLSAVKRTSCRDADISLPIPSAFGLLEKQSQVGGSRSLTADPETASRWCAGSVAARGAGAASLAHSAAMRSFGK